jgi:hypothetical protein
MPLPPAIDIVKGANHTGGPGQQSRQPSIKAGFILVSTKDMDPPGPKEAADLDHQAGIELVHRFSPQGDDFDPCLFDLSTDLPFLSNATD